MFQKETDKAIVNGNVIVAAASNKMFSQIDQHPDLINT